MYSSEMYELRKADSSHCNDLKATERRILEEHRFKADMTRTVIYGLCENCQ